MKKIINKEIVIADRTITVIVTAHGATLYTSIMGYATKAALGSSVIRSGMVISNHGIKHTEKAEKEGYCKFHCVYTY